MEIKPTVNAESYLKLCAKEKGDLLNQREELANGLRALRVNRTENETEEERNEREREDSIMQKKISELNKRIDGLDEHIQFEKRPTAEKNPPADGAQPTIKDRIVSRLKKDK